MHYEMAFFGSSILINKYKKLNNKLQKKIEKIHKTFFKKLKQKNPKNSKN
jgi:hypothetical protein